MDHMQEFAHDGHHDDAPALAACLEFTSPLREIRVVAQNGEGAHVEPLTHLSIACHRDGGLPCTEVPERRCAGHKPA